MPFEILRDDITKVKADAIVNAANSQLLAGGGVCGSIFRAAGMAQLSAECARIGHCDAGSAVFTKGCRLSAKYVIHAVGPVWRGGGHGEAELLKSCYASALNLALAHGCQSIAFPLISSGIYGYPREEALQIALSAISEFLLHNDMQVYLVIYDRSSFAISKKLFASIQSYLDENCVVEEDLEARKIQYPYEDSAACLFQSSLAERDEDKAGPETAGRLFSETPAPSLGQMRALTRRAKHPEKPQYLSFSKKLSDKNEEFSAATLSLAAAEPAGKAPASLEDALKHVDDSFQQTLLRLIDESGLSDVEVYKRANVDRKLFSKIRSNADYKPSKQTAIAFAIALELDEEATNCLLSRAGYVLSRSSKFDVIIDYFIQKKNYNIMLINEALFAFEQELLRA